MLGTLLNTIYKEINYQFVLDNLLMTISDRNRRSEAPPFKVVCQMQKYTGCVAAFIIIGSYAAGGVS